MTKPLSALPVTICFITNIITFFKIRFKILVLIEEDTLEPRKLLTESLELKKEKLMQYKGLQKVNRKLQLKYFL